MGNCEIYEDAYLASLPGLVIIIIYLLFYLVCQSRICRGGYVSSASVEEVKKGDKSITANYRPISLTCVVGKMLESIIARNVWNHLERHRLIRLAAWVYAK